jgi:transcriptional regulator with XRE-family HTH domain
MYTARDIEGQIYSNRIRRNIAQIMGSRGMAGYKGLPSISSPGLARFIHGKGDITVTRLQRVADDLGVSIFELMQNG